MMGGLAIEAASGDPVSHRKLAIVGSFVASLLSFALFFRIHRIVLRSLPTLAAVSGYGTLH